MDYIRKILEEINGIDENIIRDTGLPIRSSDRDLGPADSFLKKLFTFWKKSGKLIEQPVGRLESKLAIHALLQDMIKVEVGKRFGVWSDWIRLAQGFRVVIPKNEAGLDIDLQLLVDVVEEICPCFEETQYCREGPFFIN